MSDIRNLEPKALWNYFADICQIPHPSKKEEKIIKFMKEFGESAGLETIVDETGNVIIKKPASPGYENRKGIILQGHLDMVPQKNSDKDFDFEKDSIEPLIDGDWVTANGTTLGADNGMGVAATMAVLTDKTLQHGPVEGLFTVDEETGMTGANNLQPGMLDGEIMMNLDSEDEGELYVGCAGGINVSAKMEYVREKTPSGVAAYKVSGKGMKGGHSGMDIPLERANANKVMARFLLDAERELGVRVSEFAGGDLRNAIPREVYALVLVPEIKAVEFEAFVKDYSEIITTEFAETEPDMVFFAEKSDLPAEVMGAKDQFNIIRAVLACPNGVLRMSQSMKGMVETSNNLAIVKCVDGRFEALNLTRSSVDTAKDAAARNIAGVFELIGADLTLDGAYPGWKPNMESPILKTMQEGYNKLFGKIPEIKAIHAGLECGIIMGPYPHLDVISFGPTIRFPHSPDEKVKIDTVKKFYDFLVYTLKNAPEK
ncbi:MAG: aminoacyl-histidine dipeptidase [Marinilabiliaceae bacterium]|jgi:dipeptidase D|nr:aminoacyl-histidine dipeptidase [Marinilabiliaceae bacterium]